MKRLIATAIAGTIAASSAYAADIQPVVPMATPIVIPPPPAETGNLYVSLFGGIVFMRNVIWYQPDPEALFNLRGFRIGGAIGANLSPMLAAEGELTWARAYPVEICFDGCQDLDDTETTATLLTLMGNVRLGPTTGTFRPYVAVGGGAARLRLFSPPGEFSADGVGVGPGDTDWTWGLQAMVGVDVAVGQNLTIGARYRFQHIGPTNFIDNGDDPFSVGKFNVHSFEAGITLHFGG